MKDQGSRAKLVGGGIDVALYGTSGTEVLIDVTGLGLDEIEQSADTLSLGASVTLTELLEHPATADLYGGVLRDVLRDVASPLLRNMATVAGTIASAHPWSDMISLFLAMDARLTCYDAGGEKTIPLESMLSDRASLHTSLIVGVKLPVSSIAVQFEKFTRTGFDVGVLNCAVGLVPNNQDCTQVRIVLGGTPAIASRVPAGEQLLEGNQLTDAAIEEAATAVAEALEVRDDLRASAAYRRELAAVGVRRCLNRIAEGWSAGT